MFPKNAALLIVDVQKGFSSRSLGPRNNPNAELNIQRLISLWRSSVRPIIFVQHLSKSASSLFYPGKPTVDFKPEAMPQPNDIIIRKSENSAFIGTTLEQQLRDLGINDITVIGFTTDHCVSTTVRMGANLGFKMSIVSDATATFDRIDQNGKRHLAQNVHDINLASLHGEFARVLDTRNILLNNATPKASNTVFSGSKKAFNDSIISSRRPSIQVSPHRKPWR